MHHNKYETKLGAGKKLKDNFAKFYGKNKVTLEVDENKWDYQKFYINELENIYKVVQKIEEYSSEFTKINPKKGSMSFKCLNTNLAYLKYKEISQDYEYWTKMNNKKI